MLENTEGAIQKWTIQRNWQHWVNKTKDRYKQTQQTHHYTPTNTNNAKKT